jgi:hypothetical protein
MRVRVDAAGDYELARGVDGPIGFDVDLFADRRDRFAFDEYVSGIIIDRCDYATVFDQCCHFFLFGKSR